MTGRGASFLGMLALRRGSRAALEHARGGSRRSRRIRRIKIRPQRQPDAIRRTYVEALEKLAAEAREDVRRLLMPHGPALVAEAARLHGDALVRTLDSPAGTVSRIMAEVASDFFGEFTNERIAAVARHFGSETSDFQRREIARQFENAIGFDPFHVEPWLPTRIASFTAENVALIKTVPSRYFSDIETNLIRELRAGTRWEEIAPKLEERYGATEFNANRIARDQVGKFYGELNKARQTDVGVSRYVWRTARDNRVRDEHHDREGVSYAWGDLEADEEPGQPINCRCQGEPDMSELLEALGEGESTSVAVPEEVEAPAPEPEPEPEPVAPTFSPPATMEELHDRMREIAREVFGDEFTSTSVTLDHEASDFAAVRRWTGEIEITPGPSKELRGALESIGTGRPITGDEANSISTLLHEQIHGLGKFKAPTPVGAWSDYSRLYATPFGRVVEEGSTELRAVRGWRAFAERLGVNPGDSWNGPRFESVGVNGFSKGGSVSYMGEVRAVDTLCRYAAGNLETASAFSPAAERVLVGLSSEWNPVEKVSKLVDAILSHATPTAGENSKYLRRDLLTDFLAGQAHFVLGDLPHYLDRILAATTSDEVLAVRKWLNLP